MKFVPLFLLLFTLRTAATNEIDKLNSKADVQKFLFQKIDKNSYHPKYFSDSTNGASEFRNNRFFKLDLNSDGLTDLIIDSRDLFVVMDKGNDNFGIYYFGFATYDYRLVKILHIDNQPALVVSVKKPVNRWREPRDDSKPFHEIQYTETDTLVYKFDEFVEYNTAPENLDVSEITFAAGPCFGTCPVFKLQIQSNREATLSADGFVKNKNGNYRTVIDTGSYNTLVRTINYIKLFSVRGEYNVPWTDDRSVDLQVKLKTGETKVISDYGACGTFGLRNLYRQLYSFADGQDWKQITK